ncbi:hypothetical protein EBZ35_03040 [bacterium]|nr:hypothetical protein [bacterium]
MSKLTPIIMAALILSGVAHAQLSSVTTVSDVSPKDPSFGAITQSLRQGYFRLNPSNQFLPDTAVTRKELASILDQLLDTDANNELTRVQIQELLNLAKTFKSHTVSTTQTTSDLATSHTRLSTEQTVLHTDVSRLTDRVVTLEQQVQALASDNVRLQKQSNDHFNWLLLGLITSAIVGIIH